MAARDRRDRPRAVPEDRSVDPLPVVRERRVRARHLERVDGLRAESDREVRLQMAGDPDVVRRPDDVRRSDELRQLCEHGVVRVRRRGREVDRSEVLALVVVHRPVASADVDRHHVRRLRRHLHHAQPVAQVQRGRGDHPSPAQAPEHEHVQPDPVPAAEAGP